MAASGSGKPAPRCASSPASPECAARGFLGRLETPCRLLVGYSGGGDSTGLLVALAEALAADPDLDISLAAATVDHGLRPGSAEEARAAGALPARLSIPHHILTWEAKKPATGIQAAAREARYRLLGDLAQAIEADLILTAHNLDDQAETIVMRRARNPEARGGISEAVLYDRRVWICRPFLDVRRQAIRDYLTARGIGWVEDPSNDNDRFERVRVRKALRQGERRAIADQPQQVAGKEQSISACAEEATARYLLANAAIHSALVAVLDLAGYSVDNSTRLDAVRYLAALMGGRTHPSGRETTDRIAHFLASPDRHRFTAERVVFDRRKHLLYISRERRSLPVAAIAPGATALWDNRFRIENHGVEPAVVGARGNGRIGKALIGTGLPADLPGAVRQRVEATEPILIDGRPDQVRVKPIIAQFDRFLPLGMLAPANALAFLGGLDHFPRLPAR
jgi:tRNA(Ile)-lysidine synthase